MARTHSQQRMIVMTGPKGGIGRSTCAVALAKSLAIREHNVLLIDLSQWAALANCIDFSNPKIQTIDTLKPVHTLQNGLDYACIKQETSDIIHAHLREMTEYDDIVIDTTADNSNLACDLFLRADVPVLIADPEPSSIRMATIWLRYAFIRYLERFPENDELVTILKDCETSWTFKSIQQQLTPKQLNQFVAELTGFRCAFLLNNRRENSEILQSRALCHAWAMLLGTNIHFLGSLSYDDRRWFFARSLADVSLFMREDPLVRECDEIQRDAMISLSFEDQFCLPMIQVQAQPRQFLLASSPDEACQTYRILWEGYRRENGLVSNIFNRDETLAIIAQLEKAYKRADFEPEKLSSHSSHENQAVTRNLSQTFTINKDYHPENCADNAGIWLKSKREALGLTLAQLSLKSRIPSKILEKFEQQAFDDIPPARLQAYLFEIAKLLDLSFDDIKNKFGLN